MHQAGECSKFFVSLSRFLALLARVVVVVVMLWESRMAQFLGRVAFSWEEGLDLRC